jgi:predicted protein tyrosine phosphatase
MLSVQKSLYGVQTDDAKGHGRGNDPAHAAGCLLHHLPAVIACSLRGFFFRIDRTDGLAGGAKGRVFRVHLHTAEEGCTARTFWAARSSIPARSSSQSCRLSQRPAHPAAMVFEDHRTRLGGPANRPAVRCRGPRRSDGHAPDQQAQVPRARTLVRWAAAVIGSPRVHKRIAAKGHNNAHLTAPMVATRTALIVCIRFSA